MFNYRDHLNIATLCVVLTVDIGQQLIYLNVLLLFTFMALVIVLLSCTVINDLQSKSYTLL